MIRIILLALILFTGTANAAIVDQSIMPRLLEHKTLIGSLKEANIETRKELICLSLNAYFEARSSTVEDQVWISFVAKNRYQAEYRGAQSVCETVWKWKQFSWTHDGKSDFPRDRKAWLRAQRIAYIVYYSEKFNLEDPTRGKLHYIRYDVVNKFEWSRNGIDKQRTGAHIFLTVVNK